MSFFDFFSKETPAPANTQDDQKLIADNKQALSGLSVLAQKLNKGDDKKPSGMTMEEYLMRLRREGSGR